MMNTRRKSWLAGALTTLMVATVLSPSFAILDKTRFALHLGAAFFSFHHWVYKPYKGGDFQAGQPHRLKSMIKGGAALLFAVHEIKVSSKIAHNSSSPLLQKIAGGLDNLQAEYSTLGQKLKGGNFNPADIETMNSHVSASSLASSAAGIPIKDKETAIPGTN